MLRRCGFWPGVIPACVPICRGAAIASSSGSSMCLSLEWPLPFCSFPARFFASSSARRVRDGSYRLFRMWKFRSMVPDADERLEELRELNEADGPLFKIKDDPRVIPGVGSFIRKHSIDELPQFINVFKGDMSLIGPRPGLPREVALYDERAVRRLTVKPGCGGAWQVSGRSDVGFERMVELDLDYIDGRSVSQDFDLVLGTLRAMFDGKGAA